jgi:hypothetical protein
MQYMRTEGRSGDDYEYDEDEDGEYIDLNNLPPE